MDGLGTMSWDEFVENAEKFVSLSDELSDGWELRGEKSIPGQAYLYRNVKKFVPSNYETDDSSGTGYEKPESKDIGERHDEIEIGDFVDPYEANRVGEQPFVVEHHILWSMSYGVPVIYFNGWLSDFPGVNKISVAQAQKIIHRRTGDLGYGELSQAIHPILGTTFLHLHPCRSQELLSSTWESGNKIVSWLSAVAPVAFGLELNLRYCELTKKKNAAEKPLTKSQQD